MQTHISSKERKTPGANVVKYRLTVMSGDSANGDQLKPVVRIARILQH